MSLLGIQAVESAADVSYWTRERVAQLAHSLDALPGWSWYTRVAARSDAHETVLGLMRDGVLALALAALWTRFDRRTQHDVAAARVRVFLRYFVGAVMTVYGGFKIVPVQFPTPSASQMLAPLGELAPMTLLWVFVGSSPAYSFWCGLVEWIGGALLFSRRTVTLGALVCVVALVNVTLLNFCYDVPVKRAASLLLLAAVALASRDFGRLADVLWFDRPTAPRRERPFRGSLLARRLRRVVKPLVVALALAGPIVAPSLLSSRSGPPSPIDGAYAVREPLEPSPATQGREARWRRLVLGDRGGAVAQDLEGNRRRFTQVVDPGTRTVELGADGEVVHRFRYEQRADGGVRLDPLEPGARSLELTPLRRGEVFRVLGEGG